MNGHSFSRKILAREEKAITYSPIHGGGTPLWRTTIGGTARAPDSYITIARKMGKGMIDDFVYKLSAEHV